MTIFDEVQTRHTATSTPPTATPPRGRRSDSAQDAERSSDRDANREPNRADAPVPRQMRTTPKRHRPWKKPGKNLREQYGVTMQLGFVLALALLFGLTQIQYEIRDTFQVTLAEQEVVRMEQIQQTEQQVKPPPPPRPAPPIEVANDVVVEEQDFDFDASLDLNEELDVSASAPPPPPEPTAEETDEQEIFVVVEEQPVLIGGLRALQEHIHYPEMARKAGIEGRVIVQFVVNENGTVVNPTVVQGRHPTLDKEALRVVQLATFTPGRQRGRAVKVQIALPITFRLAASQ